MKIDLIIKILLTNSIVKNNFSLWYMVIWGPEHENPDLRRTAMISVYELTRDKQFAE